MTKTIEKAGELIDIYFEDTPKWAKFVRFSAMILTLVGGLVTANPALYPVFLVAAAPYLTTIGPGVALYVQKFTKK